jgi:hypothetical protein
LILETLKVELGERSYDIVFGVDVISRLGSLCRSLALGENVMVITNPTVGGHYFETARKSLAEVGYIVNKIIIPDGEAYKNYETLQKIYDALIEAGLDRSVYCCSWWQENRRHFRLCRSNVLAWYFVCAGPDYCWHKLTAALVGRPN